MVGSIYWLMLAWYKSLYVSILVFVVHSVYLYCTWVLLILAWCHSVYMLPKTFKFLCFPIYWPWGYLMMLISETCRVDWIGYRLFYLCNWIENKSMLILLSEENSHIIASKFGKKKMNKKVENVDIIERSKRWNIIT